VCAAAMPAAGRMALLSDQPTCHGGRDQGTHRRRNWNGAGEMHPLRRGGDHGCSLVLVIGERFHDHVTFAQCNRYVYIVQCSVSSYRVVWRIAIARNQKVGAYMTRSRQGCRGWEKHG
jgi:hypothetical protein